MCATMSGLCIDRVRAEEGGRGGHRRHERTGHSRRARASGLGFCEPKGQRYVSPRTYAWPVMGLVNLPSYVWCWAGRQPKRPSPWWGWPEALSLAAAAVLWQQYIDAYDDCNDCTMIATTTPKTALTHCTTTQSCWHGGQGSNSWHECLPIRRHASHTREQ